MSHISLKHTFSEDTDGTYTLKLYVSETSNNIPCNIFLFKRIPEIPGDTLADTEFDRVCSYADMLNYNNGTDDDVTFIRQSIVYLKSKSLITLEEFRRSIVQGTQELIDDITVNYATAPTITDTLTG